MRIQKKKRLLINKSSHVGLIHLRQALVRAYGTGQSLRGLRPRSQGVAEKVLTNIPFLAIDFLFWHRSVLYYG
jgi:hypothetical protein